MHVKIKTTGQKNAAKNAMVQVHHCRYDMTDCKIRRGWGVTFDVVHNGDNVLSKHLGGAPSKLGRLDVMEDGAKFSVLLARVDQIPRDAALFSQNIRGAASKETSRFTPSSQQGRS